MKNLQYWVLYILALCFNLSVAVATVDSQVTVKRIEQMPNIPQPFFVRDFKQVARDYDAFVFDFDREGQFLPLIWNDTTHVNFDRDGFGFPSYIGHPQMTRGAHHESINCMGAVLSATFVGIDKSNQASKNWVQMCQNYYNKKNKQNVYLNRTEATTGGSFWYEILPSILAYQLAYCYPNETGFEQQLKTTAEQWYKACEVLTSGNGIHAIANFDCTAFDLMNMNPVDNGLWIEPDAAAAVAWIEYMAWTKWKKSNYLDAVDWSLRFLNDKPENPFYEVLLPFGVYIAARVNAEQGRNYDVDKLINWCFGPSDARYGWGVIAERWGEYDCYGLVGSLIDRGGYGFAMNTFVMAEALVPMVRYDDRYARAVGKWLLNAANASRLFYPNGLPEDHQTCSQWAKQYDKKNCVTYEGLRKAWKDKSPYAMGDPLVHGWAETDFALYGASYTGFLAGLFSRTNDEKILQWDCLKTDFYHDKAFPTYLYFNPHKSIKTIMIDVGEESCNLYDCVSNGFLKKNIAGQSSFEIPADSAVLLVVIPAEGKIIFDTYKSKVNGVVIDYNNGRVPLPKPRKSKTLNRPVSTEDKSIPIKASKAVIEIDGQLDDWKNLDVDSIEMKASRKGDLKCCVKFAWDSWYLYVSVEEIRGDTTRHEAVDPADYIAEPWLFDGISFYIDIDNSNNRETVGDYNAWLGFSSEKSDQLYCARSYIPGTLSKEYMAHSKVATGGSFDNNNRVIEVAIKWSDIANHIGKERQPDGDLMTAIQPGFRFGCDPLILDDGWKFQSFYGGIVQPKGDDEKSHDVVLTE